MKALITGINGQAGSYLAEFLLKKGFEVHGLVRRHSVASAQTARIEHIRKDIHLHYGDVTDFSSVARAIKIAQPDHIYNLAAQSHVKVSEDTPIYTAHADALGLLNILEVMRINHNCQFYQASTSEMFGNEIDADGYQRETTPMKPVSPYGAAKLFAHNICNHYRKAYNMWIGCGILFNHTSVRRGETFVEKKIADGFKQYKKTGKRLELGNLSAQRDIGYAPEYVEAMYQIIQKGDDYVIATGYTWSVEEMCQLAAKELGITSIHDVVTPSEKYLRANELNLLKGDSSKALRDFGWKPKKQFPEIMKELCSL